MSQLGNTMYINYFDLYCKRKKIRVNLNRSDPDLVFFSPNVGSGSRSCFFLTVGSEFWAAIPHLGANRGFLQRVLREAAKTVFF